MATVIVKECKKVQRQAPFSSIFCAVEWFCSPQSVISLHPIFFCPMLLVTLNGSTFFLCVVRHGYDHSDFLNDGYAASEGCLPWM